MTTNDLLKNALGVEAINGFVSYIDPDDRAVCFLNNVGINIPAYFPKGDLKSGDRIKVIILKDD